MNEENLLELRRQLFHLFLGLTISFFIYFTKPIFGDAIAILPISVIFFLLFFPEFNVRIGIITHILDKFERPHDKQEFPFKGAIFYGIGIGFPIILLPLNIACAIIAILSVGDSMSTLIGKFYGKVRKGHKEKSLEGLFAFILFGFMGASIFVSWKFAILLALIGGIIEFLSFFDDNLLVPIGLTAFYFIYLKVIIPFMNMNFIL